MIGRGKGSSFFIWFLVGAIVPLFGLRGAPLSLRGGRAGAGLPHLQQRVKLYVQVCPRCGTDLDLPDPPRSGSRLT